MAEQIPTLEQMQRIFKAAESLSRIAGKMQLIVPSQWPGLFFFEIIDAIQELERARNPNRIPFGQTTRSTFLVAGWPKPIDLYRGIRLLYDSHDALIREMNCEAVSTDDVLLIRGGGADEITLSHLRVAALWIRESIEADANPEPKIIADFESWASGNVAAAIEASVGQSKEWSNLLASERAVKIIDVAERLGIYGPERPTEPISQVELRNIITKLVVAAKAQVAGKISPVGHVKPGDIKGLYPHLTMQQVEKLKQKLRDWRPTHEDQCIAIYPDNGTGFQRWAYPVMIVRQFAAKFLAESPHK